MKLPLNFDMAPLFLAQDKNNVYHLNMPSKKHGFLFHFIVIIFKRVFFIGGIKNIFDQTKKFKKF